MKRYYCVLGFISAFILLSSLTVSAQQKHEYGQFILKGKLEGRDTGKIILIYINKNRKDVYDTIQLKKGVFSFQGYIDGTTFARLIGDIKSTSVNDPNQTLIFIEPGNMTMAIRENDFANLKLTGSAAQTGLDTINKQVRSIYNFLEPDRIELIRLKEKYIYGDKSQAIIDSIGAINIKVEPYLKKVDAIYCNYILGHPDNDLSAGLMADFLLLRNLSQDSIKLLYNNLSVRVRNTAIGMMAYRSVESQLHEENGAKDGSPARGFVEKDMNNKTIDLASYKGKNYVLLDFWATWCEPCKLFIPHLKNIYNQYHNKGLEVISISEDNNKAMWKAGVMKEGMDKWENIFNGPSSVYSGDESMAKKYEITAVPTAILIDKDGNIVARYVGTDEDGGISDLNKRLADIYK